MSRLLGEHLAPLILHAIEGSPPEFTGFLEDIEELLGRKYGINFPQSDISAALETLEELTVVEIFESTLAGEMYRINPRILEVYLGEGAREPDESTSRHYDAIYERANRPGNPVKAYFYGGQRWINRVLERLLSDDNREGFTGFAEYPDVAIPASDRIIKITDNQRKVIEEAGADVALHLNSENSIGGDVELHDRFKAQLAAGLQLIRAGSVRAYLVYETLVRMLFSLIDKYKNQALGQAAKKLLDLLIEHIVGK